MKQFIEYLNESKKVYQFKIGVAGQVPEGFEDTLETVLQKYGVEKMSNGKKTPIQERPLDFPQLQNTEVTYYEVDLKYATTVQVLQEYVGNCCNLHQSHLIVRNINEPQELYQQEKSTEAYEALLDIQDMGGESAQKNAGTDRVMDLLKELELARKEREHDPINATPAGESKDISNKENTKSVVGS